MIKILVHTPLTKNIVYRDAFSGIEYDQTYLLLFTESQLTIYPFLGIWGFIFYNSIFSQKKTCQKSSLKKNCFGGFYGCEENTTHE